ncbi:MAG: DNA polymerase IV [Kiritimatiellia bacterium]
MATILHVDMDAFFASVEQLHHPEWRGRPVIVGAGPHERGVVSTCSYEARKFGVRSAMPSRTAYEKCPHGIFVRPHMELYEAVSAKAFEIFGHYTPYVEGVSIDEAFLDITGSIHLFGSARALGEALRREIRATCGVTCSVGIAANRLLAKIGSEQNKPDGLTLMPTEPAAVAEFLAPKPIGILWGIGRKTAELLRTYDIATCGSLQRLPLEQLATVLGSREAAQTLHDHACGRSDDTVHWEAEPEQSVSREHTFKLDESDRERIRATLLDLVTDVGHRFRKEKRWARTARLKLRDAGFNTITRQAPFAAPARDDISFREKALELFDRERFGAIRLIGFGVTNLQDTPDADGPSLFALPGDDRRQKRERLSDALDALRDRGLLPS